MKKQLIVLTIMLCLGTVAFAQGSFVVKAGLNFNTLQDIKVNNVEQAWNAQTGFHAGIGAQYRIPLIGLSFQPELLYSRMRTGDPQEVNDNSYKFRLDYLEVPLNIQWGINILFLRPYIFASPYVRYALAKGDWLTDVPWEDINRFDYGLSLGAGIEIWKLQVSGKYSWSFGHPFHIDSDDRQLDDANFRGFELSVAFLF